VNLDRFEAVLEEQAALGFDGVQILSLFRVGPDATPAAKALHFGPGHRAALEARVPLLSSPRAAAGSRAFVNGRAHSFGRSPEPGRRP
jgi:hypothetical protein